MPRSELSCRARSQFPLRPSTSVSAAAATAAAFLAKHHRANTSAGARVGGSDRNVARGTVSTGGNNADVRIGNRSGPLVSGTSNGNPVNGNSDSDVDVNLGALGGFLGGLPGGGVPGGGTPGGVPGGGSVPGDIRDAFGAMSAGQQAELKITCQSVLNAQQRYDASMIQLCQMLRLL